MSADREIDTMNTSSIDLICCALGGLLMLMLFVATLVRAKAERGDTDAGNDGRTGKELVAEGFASAPPKPLIVTLSWKGTPRYPLQLVAFPPRVIIGEAKQQSEFRLTEENGVVSIGIDGESYFGFFDRSMVNNSPQLRLVIPGGSRSVTADTARRQKREKVDKSHVAEWQFEVTYPNTVPELRPGVTAANGLKHRFEQVRAFTLVAHAAETTWNGQGNRPLPRLTKASEKLRSWPLPELLVKKGEGGKVELKPPRDFAAASDAKYAGVQSHPAGEAAVAFDIDAGVRVVGFPVIAGADTKPRRVEALMKVWREAILPGLVEVATHTPGDEKNATAERHEVALRVVRAIEERLKQVNSGLGDTGTILWEDLTGETFDTAIPGSGEWLAEMREYHALFLGTHPTLGGDVKVTLTVRAYPENDQKWAASGKREVTLGPGDRAMFQTPKP